jgi:hypothetical protein
MVIITWHNNRRNHNTITITTTISKICLLSSTTKMRTHTWSTTPSTKTNKLIIRTSSTTTQRTKFKWKRNSSNKYLYLKYRWLRPSPSPTTSSKLSKKTSCWPMTTISTATSTRPNSYNAHNSSVKGFYNPCPQKSPAASTPPTIKKSSTTKSSSSICINNTDRRYTSLLGRSCWTWSGRI